jgi:acyl-CoA synthetase
MRPGLAAVIDGHAASRPDGIAFYEAESATPWAEYARRSRALAAALVDLGLERGERVGVLLPDGAGVHSAFVATERAGLVAVGIGPRAGYKEVQHLLALTGAVALVTRREYREEPTAELFARLRGDGVPLRHHLVVPGDLELESGLEIDGAHVDLVAPDPGAEALEARRLGPDDLWLLNSTSGTTGMPKCVMHHQDRWLYFHELALEAGALRSDDVFMSVIPAPFGFGLWTAHFTPALLGAPCVLLERFTPEGMIDALERRRVSVLAAVSTQFIMLLNALEAGRDLSSLRALFTGGERVPYARAAEFEQRTGARVLQFYGSNETGAVSRTRVSDPRERRLRTAGKPIPGMQLRLFDAQGNDVTASGRGQPGVKGRATSRGYWRDAAANRELIRPDGWVLLGDLVSIDAEGYLSVEGRVGDFIIRGGKNISGPAVEEAAATHPAVKLAAAVAMPDPVFGERVCLYAELVPGGQLTLAELTGHMERAGVSKEYLPERLVIAAELPRSSGGKIAKQALREDIARRLAAEAP